jgi:pyruvate kinase
LLPFDHLTISLRFKSGPASNKVDVLKQLILAGVDIFRSEPLFLFLFSTPLIKNSSVFFDRLNFSHGQHSEFTQIHANIKEASAAVGIPVGILADLQGPKFRTGMMENDGATVNKGDVISVVTRSFSSIIFPTSFLP